jgi:Cof subfamily protein (haloacid dehalogenase superfamily)
MPLQNLRIVAVDLDGTLLPNRGRISRRDVDTLRMLGNRGIVRVLATGRSFYSTLQNIPRTFPIDYLVFSTGVGVMDWRSGEVIYSAKISSARVKVLIDELTKHKLDFMLHSPAPNTHHFYYRGTDEPISDFHERKKHYPDFCQPLPKELYPESCQALAFMPHDLERYERIAATLEGFKVVRTTSPINGKNLWMEVFERNVSKGDALELLAQRLGVKRENVMAVGNDYNDLDMLHYASSSYVVANAPEVLKALFKNVPDVASSGFSDAVADFLANG